MASVSSALAMRPSQDAPNASSKKTSNVCAVDVASSCASSASTCTTWSYKSKWRLTRIHVTEPSESNNFTFSCLKKRWRILTVISLAYWKYPGFTLGNITRISENLQKQSQLWLEVHTPESWRGQSYSELLCLWILKLFFERLSQQTSGLCKGRFLYDFSA